MQPKKIDVVKRNARSKLLVAHADETIDDKSIADECILKYTAVGHKSDDISYHRISMIFSHVVRKHGTVMR